VLCPTDLGCNGQFVTTNTLQQSHRQGSRTFVKLLTVVPSQPDLHCARAFLFLTQILKLLLVIIYIYIYIHTHTHTYSFATSAPDGAGGHLHALAYLSLGKVEQFRRYPLKGGLKTKMKRKQFITTSAPFIRYLLFNRMEGTKFKQRLVAVVAAYTFLYTCTLLHRLCYTYTRIQLYMCTCTNSGGKKIRLLL